MEQEIKGGVERRIANILNDRTLDGEIVIMAVHSWKPDIHDTIVSYLKTHLSVYIPYAKIPDHYVKVVSGIVTSCVICNSVQQYGHEYEHGYKYCAVLDSIADAASAMRVKRAARIKQINDSKAIRSILPPELANIVQNYTVNTIDVFN